MPNKPRQKRERNIYGDFVVTKINIKERVVEIPKVEGEEEEEEESSSEEEVEEQVPEPEEEKKAPVKILSKKEQKRLEEEEFDRVMNEMGSANTETAAATTEESKG